MKKLCLVTALLLALLCACQAAQPEPPLVSQVTQDGVVYTVDREARTITQGEQVYRYEVEHGADRDTIIITYPNGATYHRMRFTGALAGGEGSGWNTVYEQEHDVSGKTLMAVLDQALPAPAAPRSRIWNGPHGFLFLALGLWGLLKPNQVWYLSRGWQFKNAEPSEAALMVNRIAGGFLLFIGVLLLFSFS